MKNFLKKHWKKLAALLLIPAAFAANEAFTPVPEPIIVDTKTPQMDIDGQTVTFGFTDDNTNENLLLYTDAPNYQSLTQIKPKVAVVNNSGVGQNVSLQAYFQNSKRQLATVSQITAKHASEDTVIVPDYDCPTMDNCTKTGQHTELHYTNERVSQALQSPRAEPIAAKTTTSFVSNGPTFFLAPGETQVFELTIDLHPDKENSLKPEEFFIEAIGDAGGYGHLDPAIALVTHDIKAGSGATSNAIDTTGATLLIVGLSFFSNAGTAAPTDSKGNTWRSLTIQANANGDKEHMWYAWDHGGTALSVGSGHTFTAPAGSFGITVIAFSGTQTSSDPLDQQNGAQNSAVTSLATGSITPTQDNEVVVSYDGMNRGSTLTIDSGMTVTDRATFSGGSIFGQAMAYIVQTTATAINPTWSWVGSSVDGATIASFKAAAADVSSSSTPVFLQF